MLAPYLNWHPLGAHLLQATIGGQSLFYVSPLVAQFTDRPPRAGVPVMFPQFAERGGGPKHGLVRMLPWQAERADAFTLSLPPQPDLHWHGHAKLQVAAAVTTTTLTMHFTVHNTGDAAFTFTGGLHPYFQVDDVKKLQIEGLTQTPYEDRYGSALHVSQPFLTGQAFERLYHQSPAIVLDDGTRRLRLSASGFDNWMVWNPGVELARGLADLPDDDWQRFVCVEPVAAARAVQVEAGQRFEATFTIERL